MAAKREVRDIYPLTPMQQGMLVHALRTPDEPVYQQQYVLAVSGVPDESTLRQGIADLVARHPVLRTGFAWEGVAEPLQVVFADAAVPLRVTAATESTVDDLVAAALAELRAERFDLRRPPLLRARLVRVGPAEWRLVTTAHHLVLDGWSMPTVQAELAELLAARLAGLPARLAPAAPFREFVAWLRDHDTGEAAAAHFKRLLGDLRHPTPLGMARVARVSTGVGPAGRVVRHVPGDPTRRPDTLARSRGLLPSTIAHAAWGLLLARAADTADAVFGTTVAGRPAELPGVTERVGMFVNTVPVRVAVAGDALVGPWLADVQEQLVAARSFEQTPVAVAQRCSGVPMGEPLYESVLGFQNYFVQQRDAPPDGPVTVRALHQQEQTGLPLVVSVALPAGSTWVRVEYDERRIDRPVAEWLADRYVSLLGELAAAPDDLPLRDIPLADPAAVRPTRPRGASRSFAELIADVPAMPMPGIRPGDRVVLALPAATLVAAAVGALAAGAEVTQVPSAASATELAEHCAGAAALVVPEGTAFAVPPGVPIVPWGPLAPVTSVVDGGRWRGASVATLAEAVDVVLRSGDRVGLPAAPDDAAFLPLALAGVPATGGWRVHGTCGTGGVFACVAPGESGLGVVPGGRLVDRFGGSVPDGVAGELVVNGEPTGVWARRAADGTLEHLGDRPGNEDVWVRDRLLADDAVTDAAVLGERAWVVPAGLDVPALLGRLRRSVPSALLPGDIRSLPALPLTAAGHVDVAALTGPPPEGPRAEPRPIAARLAALPADRRDLFLAGLRAAQRTVPLIRPGRAGETAPTSVQQRFYATARLRDWVRGGSAGPVAAAVEHDSVSAGAEQHGPLCYADYATWQLDPRRATARDEQAAYWRAALRAAPAAGVPADRVPPDAPAIGETTVTVPVTAPPHRWLGALAVVLACWGRDDDVVLGVVTRPHLPAELAGVRGPFSRMLPVRVAVPPDSGLSTVADTAAAALAAARRNADVPWPELRSLLAEDPLVSVAVHTEPGALAAHAAATIGLDIAPDPAGGTTVTAVFDGRAITGHSVAALLRWCVLALSRDPDLPLTGADLVTEDERAALLRAAVGGAVDGPGDTVPGLVACQDRDAVAVVAEDGELTYGDLLDRATNLAAALRERGIGIEDRVAVCLPRIAATVWAPLGVMLAGAAYVPIEPTYPRGRIEFVCADAALSAVVTTEELAGLFPDGVPVVAPDAQADLPSAPVPPARHDSAAYVIYTSGSTGQPKGVLVEHRSVVDFVRHIATAYRIGPGTRLLGFAALSFDVSVFDLWAAVGTGATLVLAGDEERLSVDRLRRLLIDQGVTAAELPPALMPLLDPSELPELRLVSVGGEAPAGALVNQWATDRREFWNGYGPAETTVAVTLMRCTPPSGGRIPPIGLPMPNHRVYVLDERLRPLPAGVPGELCVAGAGLARGYLGQPGQTADRFVPDPFAATPGERLYRTGDLVRWAPDGVLDFLGRVDRQVKLRGFRVEPSEVESVLAADGRVRQVAVEVWDDGQQSRHLTAYEPPTLAEIREIASVRLPDYMVPTRLATLDELPRTPSGKIDRRSLPAPPTPDGGADAADAAWTELERTIAADVLGPLLRLTSVGREQDFFELGGNSLQATQVTSRVRDVFGVEIGLADFLAEPTSARLAALVEQERLRAAVRRDEVYADRPKPRMTPGTVLPQSFPQQALFQADERYGHDPRYNAPSTLRMRGPLDLDALRRAFTLNMLRHPTLRVALYRDGDEYLQRVLAPADLSVDVVDVEGEDVGARLRTVRGLVREEGWRAFDLGAGPMMRATVWRLGPDDHVVQWTVHHMAIDGWSMGNQWHEIGTAYHAYAAGAEPELPPIEADYAEFVQWHRDYVAGPRYPEDVDVWRERLRGLTGITLPTGRERAGHTFRPGYLDLRIEPGLATAIHALGRRAGTSLYMTTLAAYATVLAAHAGADDVAVITPNSLRMQSSWERLIGWFVNRVLIRVPLDRSATFTDLLRTIRGVTTAAFGRQAVPFESLRAELQLPDAALAACFSVQNAPVGGEAFRSSEFDMESVADDSGVGFAPIGPVYAPLGLRYETSVVLRPRHDGAVTGGWEYDAALYDEEVALRWRAGFYAVLARASGDQEVTVRELCAVATDAGQVDSLRS
jgi:amino acid adenylation domain-containing protein